MPRSTGEKYVLGSLDARSATRLLHASSDFALVLDDDGTILEVLAQGDDAAARAMRSWRGQSWLETVTAESRQKVEAMLHDAQASADAAARWRQVNHPVDDDDELPLMYATVRVDDEDARGRPRSRIVAFGRDLRAVVSLQRRLIDTQQAMERDYWRFREAETRYRHLFETSSEAVLIVDGGNQRVLEANPVARQMFAAARSKVVGAAFASLFDAAHAARVQDLLAAARSIGRQTPTVARLASGDEIVVSASVFRQEDAAYVLVRLAPSAAAADERQGGRRSARGGRGIAADAQAGMSSWQALLEGFIDASPDGFVFCDADGRVRRANRAFLALAQLTSEDQARGQTLDRWLGRTGVELGVLIGNLRQRGTVGLFHTTLRGEYGALSEIEVAGSLLPDPAGPVLAFAVRDVERRPKSADGGAAAPTLRRSAAELAELVGRTPLKEIVAETTDLIEQLCIQTALGMTRDNRASAAQLLGLSRQSLYVKLRRYGLLADGDGED